MGTRWTKIGVGVNRIGAILSILATAYLAAVGRNAVWSNRGTELTAIGLIGVIAIGSTGARWRQRDDQQKQTQQQLEAAAPLRTLTWTVYSNDPSLPYPELGASAWIIEGFRDRRLRRIGRHRLNANPVPSSITWTKNKGVLGRCWAEEAPQVVDTSEYDQKFNDSTQAQWDALPYDERLGLDYGEYRKIVGKYGTVLAFPILTESGKILGCVTLDAPAGHHDALDTPGVEEAVAGAAALVALALVRLADG